MLRNIGSVTFDKEIDMQGMERVIALAESICGDRAKAAEWLNQPLGTFDGKTPLQLIDERCADAVIAYLHSIASGFAG